LFILTDDSYEPAFSHPLQNLFLKMLVLEVQLPQQEGRKKIEWNKNGDPTFEEVKARLQQCGVPGNWCVEVLRGSKFFSPDLQTHIHGPKITVRAAPILGRKSYPSSHQLPLILF
jgi:hypothetical protein